MTEMDAYRDMFLAESADYLQLVTEGLLALERDPADLAHVETVFRGAHSLKGMAAAMSYDRTADLTHKMEGLMELVRSGGRVADMPLINLMLAAVDLVRDLITDESSSGTEVDASEMIAALEAMRQGAGEQSGSDAGMVPPTNPANLIANADPSAAVWRVRVTLEEACVLKAVRAYMVIKRLSQLGDVVDTKPSARDIEDERFDESFEVLVATLADADVLRDAALHVTEVADASAELIEVARAEVQGQQVESLAPESRRRELAALSETQTVRVSIGHLDTLVNLVGELVILRSRLDSIMSQRDDAELTETIDELQRISTDLQYEVMQTRMVPVSNIFNRFPRMVRDLAVDLGKQVDFTMEGLGIELDRTVLDEIGDPLVHLLRNSIDHGVEPPEVRAEQGKAPIGRITLSARRERDHVAVVVSDDGKGIDPSRVWSKACDRGIVAEADKGNYSESDVLMFTCVPGFTTVDTTTKVSGRGVGLDAVKGKIEHLGGSLRIDSRLGQGTDFVLRLPFTLAILQALLLESRGQIFALPLSVVEEAFSADEVVTETIDGKPVVVLRDGDVVQLHRLDSILYGSDPTGMPEPGSSIVLVSTGDERRALHADSLKGRQEVVIKPLSKILRNSRGFSGATILGDGRVMLILDPRTLFSPSEA